MTKSINVLRECHKYLNILNALKLIGGEKPKITKNLLRRIEVNFVRIFLWQILILRSADGSNI